MDSRLVIKDTFNPDFYIAHKIIYTAETDQTSHYHDSFEIFFAMSDGYRGMVNEKVYPIEKGDLVVFNSFDIHHGIYTTEKPREFYVVHFMPQYIRDLSIPPTNLLQCFTERGPDFSHRVHLHPDQVQDLTALFDKAIYYYENKGYGHNVYQKILLAEILLSVNSYFQQSETAGRPDQTYKSGKISPILDYINLHYNEDISIGYLAQKFYLSRDYLGTLFKRATGYTVKEYIVSRRMICAKQQLLKNVPISRVMENVGYKNYSYFIQAFKKYVGVTPKQFLKKI